MKKAKKLNISFSLKLKYSSLNKQTDLESKYQSIYRNIASFFYQNPKNHISVFFPGKLLLWIDDNHPEFSKIFTKMIARRQIEILGGGFYEPLLPTIFPLDRSGQVEYLTSEVRRVFGKRPRGVVFYGSVWENSLIPSLQNCGMEYVILDNTISSGKNVFLPYISNEKGKSIKILLQNALFTPTTEISPEDYISMLLTESEMNIIDDSSEKIVSVGIDEDEFKILFDSGWLEKFYSCALNEFSEKVNISFPLDYFEKCDEFVQCYVPSGMKSSFESSTVFDYLLSHPRSKSLYNRMLHISMLLSQCKGDRGRRNAARDNLWIAQSGEAYLSDSKTIRQYAYRNLVDAEKIIRETFAESDGFRESSTSYDYDGDGHNEYIFSMERFFACVSPRYGQIFEFDVMKNSGNYTDNDNGKGLFISHLFNKDGFDKYKKEAIDNSDVFSKKIFAEVDFSGRRNEVKLLGMGEYLSDDVSEPLPVSIIKKFVANSSGFMVQFILKNESQFPIRGTLVVESNFTQMSFDSDSSYKVEVIHGTNYTTEQKNLCDIDSSESVPKDFAELPDISFMQITDTANDISFVYEPNENCDVILHPDSSTFVASLCWNVDLVGGLEMEKTINFAVVTPRKKRK